MPDESPAEVLAGIAAVTDDLDRVLDKLFASAAELKVILARSEPGTEGGPP